MNPMKIFGAVKSFAQKAQPIMDSATSALYLGSFLTAGKKEKQAKQEMRDEQTKADVKAVVTQRQADLIDKL